MGGVLEQQEPQRCTSWTLPPLSTCLTLTMLAAAHALPLPHRRLLSLDCLLTWGHSPPQELPPATNPPGLNAPLIPSCSPSSPTLCTDRLHSRERHRMESYTKQHHARRPPAGILFQPDHVILFLYHTGAQLLLGLKPKQNRIKESSTLAFRVLSPSDLILLLKVPSYECRTWNKPRHEQYPAHSRLFSGQIHLGND